ncbi:hypothetical protein GE061_004483 [Apolygus lucorum]|uniref:Uncharacterized protein n=1 Tax=Apolygus lucorum TaxID=248454 RepID=A0A6A4IP36_APOLU|nr:hypothetical protein GE061_004483 [Apolygus lucorum]
MMSAVKFVVVLASTLALVSSSAIPMWEFLSRGEKMSHLFNMFVKQVSEHCDTSDMPDCQKVLLVYGLTNLAKMEDDSLDKMDPYQRGANDIIWESMMHGSYKKKEKNDEHRDYYADAMEPSTSEGNHLGSQEEASTNVEKFSTSNRYIVGPMVVRVLPDGSPVPRDDPLPKDEDAEEFLAMRSKPVPSLDDIATSRHHEVVATRRDSHTSMKRSKH